jgi:hypothetical protein
MAAKHAAAGNYASAAHAQAEERTRFNRARLLPYCNELIVKELRLRERSPEYSAAAECSLTRRALCGRWRGVGAAPPVSALDFGPGCVQKRAASAIGC